MDLDNKNNRAKLIRARLRVQHLHAEANLRCAKHFLKQTEATYAHKLQYELAKLKSHQVHKKSFIEFKVAEEHHEAIKLALHSFKTAKERCRYLVLARAMFNNKGYYDVERTCQNKVDSVEFVHFFLGAVMCGRTTSHFDVFPQWTGENIEKWLAGEHPTKQMADTEIVFPSDESGRPIGGYEV